MKAMISTCCGTETLKPWNTKAFVVVVVEAAVVFVVVVVVIVVVVVVMVAALNKLEVGLPLPLALLL